LIGLISPDVLANLRLSGNCGIGHSHRQNLPAHDHRIATVSQQAPQNQVRHATGLPGFEIEMGVFCCCASKWQEARMKTAFAALFAICFGGAALAAQGAGQQPGAHSSFGVAGIEGMTAADQMAHLILPAHAAESCPVSMHAGHLADGSLVRTTSAYPHGIGQWLSFSLTGIDGKQIREAKIAVHGIRPNAHVTEALSTADSFGAAVQTLNVKFSSGPHQTALAKLWVPGMSAVERIDLLSMNYDDGSSWKLAEGASCHVTPDPLMLITRR
jgi:hypothetical protein